MEFRRSLAALHWEGARDFSYETYFQDYQTSVFSFRDKLLAFRDKSKILSPSPALLLLRGNQPPGSRGFLNRTLLNARLLKPGTRSNSLEKENFHLFNWASEPASPERRVFVSHQGRPECLAPHGRLGRVGYISAGALRRRRCRSRGEGCCP